MTTCGRCGATGARDGEGTALPPGWSLETTRRGIAYLCLACTRAHVRDIEAKLDEEWWG